MADIVCIGCALADIMVEGLKVEKEKIRTEFQNRFHFTDRIRMTLGGDALNEALVLGKLKKKVALICGLGEDLIGWMIADQAPKAGVDISNVVWDSDSDSQINILLIQEDKEKYFIEEPAPKVMYFIPSEEALKGARIVTLASLFSPPFDRKDVIYQTILNAKKNEAILCADVILTPFTHIGLEELQDSLALIDYFFPNEEEARILTGKQTVEEMGEVFCNYGIKNVIIKRGDKGCYVRNSQGEWHMPAYRGRLVDATGAGDCFLAGFTAALLENQSLEECVRFASAAALLAVGSIGATTGISGRENIEEILNQQQSLQGGGR